MSGYTPFADLEVGSSVRSKINTQFSELFATGTSNRAIFNGLDGNGVVSGVVISINADPTKIDISTGVVHILGGVDTAYAGQTAAVLTYLATNNVTYLALNSSGVLIQQATPFTMAQRRDYILIGVAVHSNRTTVNAVNNLPDVAASSAAQINDLIDALDTFNIIGNDFTANGANLFLNKSVGSIFKKGVNFTIDPKSPHEKVLAALTAPSNIRYRLSDGTEYADTNSVSLYYETPIGTRAALTTGKFSTQRITVFSSNLVRIQYGQAAYNSMQLALQAINTEPFITESNIAENGLLRYCLIISGDVTSLLDTANAMFIPMDRFGIVPILSAGGTTSTQQAYANSLTSTPEITTDSTHGAFSVKRGTAADTDNVIETLNGAGAIKGSIKGDGQANFEKLGVGVASPTAAVHVKAGGTAAGTAPFKLTTQAAPLTAVEQGAFELVGNSLQFSQLVKRRGVAMSQGVLLADLAVSNTTLESTAIITAEHGANYLEVGKCEEIVLRGVIGKRVNDTLSIFIKYAGVTIQTITTASPAITAGTPFTVTVAATVRSIGATGTMQLNSVLWIDGVSNIPDSNSLVTINTTTAQNTTITAQWDTANASDTFVVNQGRVLCIEPNR